MKTKTPNVFHDPDVVKCLSSLHDKYVIVPADKVANNFVFVCKDYYLRCLVNELGSTSTYSVTAFTKEEILQNHQSVVSSFGIAIGKDNHNLPNLYWIPKLIKILTNNALLQGQRNVQQKNFHKCLQHY